MSDDNDVKNQVDDIQEDTYEMSPEEATGLKPVFLKRKKILIFICISLSLIVCGGLILNSLKPKKNNTSAETEMRASNTSSEFLTSLQNRALSRREDEPASAPEAELPKQDELPKEEEPLLPAASISRTSRTQQPQQPQQPEPPQQQAPPPSSSGSQPSRQEPYPTHYRSSLVPAVEGRLFSQSLHNSQTAASNTSGSRNPVDDYYSAISGRNASPSNQGLYGNQVSDYTQQNDQANKQSFFDPSTGGIANSGYYLGENALWTGTVIPGVLETAINTDLPGNVLARVTQNIYDSQTGRKLLLPQGTLLLARYNSSISYAQHRIQIVWDTMIRPDGFQIDLEGAGGVDKSGMSGQAARYHENWFEYLKAAGIITLFSIANAKMTETAAAHATESTSANIAESNSALVNQLGGNLASRAMNIQPTLTVDNGTQINIMLNKTVYLPPVPNYPATQRYILE